MSKQPTSRSDRLAARHALEAYRAAVYAPRDFEDMGTAITDLVADLLHIASGHGYDPERITEAALDHHAAETETD